MNSLRAICCAARIRNRCRSLHLLALDADSTQGLHDTWLGYTDYPGDPALRVELTRRYKCIEARHVLAHTGAQEAIFSFMHAMLTPGDHAIVHMPVYQSHYAVTQAMGVSVSPWQAQEQAKWQLDPDALAGLVETANARDRAMRAT